MRRTCERPGCAEPASVAFAMVPEDLLVWLEACDPATLGDERPGLLCRRHADAMVVPMGWTLDDRREAVPRLFKVREAPAAPRPTGDHTGRLRRPKMHQASLLDLVAQEMIDDVSDPSEAAARPDRADRTDASALAATEPDSPAAGPVAGDTPTPEPVTDADAVPPAPEAGAEQEDEPADASPAWSPRFDRSDDLGGLLAPRGKLLRRAFGAEPPR